MPSKKSKQSAPSKQQAQQQQVDAAENPVLLKQPLSSVQIAGRVLSFALRPGTYAQLPNRSGIHGFVGAEDDVVRAYELATVSGAFHDALTTCMPQLQRRVFDLGPDVDEPDAERYAGQLQLLRRLLAARVPDLAWLRIVSASLLRVKKIPSELAHEEPPDDYDGPEEGREAPTPTFDTDPASSILTMALRTTKDAFCTLVGAREPSPRSFIVDTPKDFAERTAMDERRDGLLIATTVNIIAYVVNGFQEADVSIPAGRGGFSVAEQARVALSLVERRMRDVAGEEFKKKLHEKCKLACCSRENRGHVLCGMYGVGCDDCRRPGPLDSLVVDRDPESDRNITTVVAPTLFRAAKLGLATHCAVTWFHAAIEARHTPLVRLLAQHTIPQHTLSDWLVEACLADDEQKVEFLLLNTRSSASRGKNEYDRNPEVFKLTLPLEAAVRAKSARVVSLLVDNGASKKAVYEQLSKAERVFMDQSSCGNGRRQRQDDN